jgi:hypothetical protein
MSMLMIAFRSSLKERVHEFLRTCNVFAYTEIPETIGTGQTGPAEGASFHPGVNSVILVALDPTCSDRVASAVKDWCTAPPNHPGWVKPAIRVFSWPCTQFA